MFRKFIALTFSLAMVSACAPDAERAVSSSVPSGPAVEAVSGLMEAFNDHDAEAMREFWADDVAWIELSGEQSSIITSSAEELYRETKAYFEAIPTVRSSLENVAVNGNYVSAIERPVWEENGERKSQASVVVYEIEAGKVKRFWYYPSQ